MDVVELINWLLLFISFILLIIEMVFWEKFVVKIGITIYTEEYNSKMDYFVNNIGKTFEKKDVNIIIIDKYHCIFNYVPTLFIVYIHYPLFGYIKLIDNKYYIKFRIPFSLLLIIILLTIILFTKVNIINIGNLLFLLGIIFIIIAIPVIMIILKISAMKYDIEEYLFYGK
jgi:hypothetical protein